MAPLPWIAQVGIAAGFGVLAVVAGIWWFLKAAYGSDTERPDPPSPHGDRERQPPGGY